MNNFDSTQETQTIVSTPPENNESTNHVYTYIHIHIEKKEEWRNRKRYNRYWQVYRFKEKLKVLIHYSGRIPRCKKCGICDVRFLVIDHINGNGELHRNKLKKRGSHFYHWLIKEDFPEGFQVLCYYCNLKKNRRELC